MPEPLSWVETEPSDGAAYLIERERKGWPKSLVPQPWSTSITHVAAQTSLGFAFGSDAVGILHAKISLLLWSRPRV